MANNKREDEFQKLWKDFEKVGINFIDRNKVPVGINIHSGNTLAGGKGLFQHTQVYPAYNAGSANPIGTLGNTGNSGFLGPNCLRIRFLFTMQQRDDHVPVTGEIVFVQFPGVFYRCTAGIDKYYGATSSNTAGLTFKALWEEVFVAEGNPETGLSVVAVIRSTALPIKLSKEEEEKYQEFEKLIPVSAPVSKVESTENYSEKGYQTSHGLRYATDYDPGPQAGTITNRGYLQ